MVIKIDLEKAYDRLDWNFVIDSLRDIGLNDHFCQLIWNRKTAGEFHYSRGIR